MERDRGDSTEHGARLICHSSMLRLQPRSGNASAILNQMPHILGRDGSPAMATKHPEISVTVEASGDDYRLVDHVIKAMRGAGVATAEIEEFCDEAMSGADRELHRICSRWVTLVPR
jgi:hypothetical protein